MKKETIEKHWISAVGEKIYKEAKDNIDPNGWYQVSKTNEIPLQLLFMFDSRFNDKELRPKTLNRIEDNFGWSKPTEDGLPKKTGTYIFLCTKNIQHPFYLIMPLSKEDVNFYQKDFTHYKPLKIEPLPLH